MPRRKTVKRVSRGRRNSMKRKSMRRKSMRRKSMRRNTKRVNRRKRSSIRMRGGAKGEERWVRVKPHESGKVDEFSASIFPPNIDVIGDQIGRDKDGSNFNAARKSVRARMAELELELEHARQMEPDQSGSAEDVTQTEAARKSVRARLVAG